MDLLKEAEKIGIEISSEKEKMFEKYAEMMLEYNKFVNLTAITEPDEIKEKHFLDSISLLTCGKLEKGFSMIDIGSGAGFPSIPVKIVRGDIKLTMLDSLNKRVTFLNNVKEELGFCDCEAIHSRAEEAGKNKKYREKYDVATARAVADLSVLAELTLPFVKVGGYFIAMKGNAPSEELDGAKKAIKTLGGETEEVKKIILPSGIEHSLIIIKKIEKTPDAYPRKAGTPAKNPLR